MTSAFAVLAEPRRRRILDLLRERERPVGELVDALGGSQPAVSKHLRVLHEGGVVDPLYGEVLAVEPPRILELRCGPDVLRFELEPDGEGTRFTLLDTVDDVGKAACDGAGWHVCLDALAHHLDGSPAP